MNTSSNLKSIDSDEEKPSSCKKNNLSLLVLGLSTFLGGCTVSFLAPFYTKEAERHGLSATASGSVFSAVFILQTLFTPIFGKYIHFVGPRNAFLAGMVICGVANITFGFVYLIESPIQYFVASLSIRLVTAIGEAALNISVFSLARNYCLSNNQSSIISWMESMNGCGCTVGPLIGGVLFHTGGFWAPFVICGSLLILSGSCGCFILNLQVEKVSRSNSEFFKDDTEASYKKVLRNPLNAIACSVTIFTGMSCQWYQPILEPYLRSEFGLNTLQASLMFTVDGVVYAFVSPIVGKLIDLGLNEKVVMLLGCSTVCVAFLQMASVFMTSSLLQICLGAILHGVGMSLNFIGTLALLTKNFGQSEQLLGMVTSLWFMCESIGSFIGGWSGAVSYDLLGWKSSCGLVAGAQLFCTTLVIIFWTSSPVISNVKNYEDSEYKQFVQKNKSNYKSISV